MHIDRTGYQGSSMSKRQTMRLITSLVIIAFGVAFVVYYKDWTLKTVPVPYVGYAFIAVGVLALLGVNVFYGGPLDKRRD
jgi:hypothetical protein